jgi:hypothetical protein
VEVVSNLVWAIVALALIGTTYRGVRRGVVRLPMARAITLALLIGFILLPVISVSDDLLEAHQAALPLSGQTWRIASEGVSAGLDKLLTIGFILLLLMSFLTAAPLNERDQWDIRPLAGRLARSQRLRPPPSAAY